jgi:poly(3-hydroxybutyrate) depolymerase
MALHGALLVFACLLRLLHAFPQHHTIASRGSSGCGKSQLLPGLTEYRSLKSSGEDRSYTYHLPSSYNSDKAYPIVVGFHGSSSIGYFFELDTKMDEARYSDGKIMVYPNGIDYSWAGPTYHNGSSVAEDVQFVKDVIEDVKGRFCVDEDRVFGAG